MTYRNQEIRVEGLRIYGETSLKCRLSMVVIKFYTLDEGKERERERRSIRK